MRPVRACIRLAALAVWLLGGACLVLVVRLVSGFRTELATRRAASLAPAFHRGVRAILGIAVRVTGEPPRGAALLAPNHWGYADVFVLGAILPTRFVSRADVADWPVMGFFARASGTLFIDRALRRDAARIASAVETELRRGAAVTAFLEGGAGDGRSVRRFKSPLLAAATATGTPCTPVALTYSLPLDADLSPHDLVAWTTDGFVAHFFRLLGARRIDAVVRFLPPRTGSDRKALARQLQVDVAAASGLPAT